MCLGRARQNWVTPKMMNIDAIVAAVVKRNIFVPTAVPKILALSLAPNDQPKNKPLDKNSKYSNIS